MLVIDNSQDFIHYEEPGGPKMIRSLSYQKWYALSTKMRLDFPKKITISDIVWDSWRTGIIQNNKESEYIFELKPQANRYMPYEENYQLAITYEVDPTEYQQER